MTSIEKCKKEGDVFYFVLRMVKPHLLRPRALPVPSCFPFFSTVMHSPYPTLLHLTTMGFEK